MYEAKNYEDLLGLNGFSDELLKNHFTLYQGYVTNTNKALETLASLQIDDKMAAPEFAEVKRRLSWEFDGMRLHEYYFENMMKGAQPLDKNSDLYKKIEKDFGSYENWEKNFKATGAMRGIGWVILYYDKQEDKLLNVWINEHDGGHLAGCQPILVMDVFEHAYMVQYGLKKPDYIEVFMKNICWHVASSRFNLAR